MIKVAFLFDESNNWVAQYFPKNLLDITLKKFEFVQIYDEKDLINFDIVFVLGYTKILNKEILKANKLLLVVHESNLPKGKGFSPIQWQILEGKNTIPVCLIRLAEKVDNGEIYEKDNIELNGTELYEEIRFKQAEITYKLIKNFLKKYPNNLSSNQVGIESFYRKRNPKDSKLDIEKPLKDQFNLLRICNNLDWPAYFELNGIKYILKIDKANLKK